MTSRRHNPQLFLVQTPHFTAQTPSTVLNSFSSKQPSPLALPGPALNNPQYNGHFEILTLHLELIMLSPSPRTHASEPFTSNT